MPVKEKRVPLEPACGFMVKEKKSKKALPHIYRSMREVKELIIPIEFEVIKVEYKPCQEQNR